VGNKAVARWLSHGSRTAAATAPSVQRTPTGDGSKKRPHDAGGGTGGNKRSQRNIESFFTKQTPPSTQPAHPYNQTTMSPTEWFDAFHKALREKFARSDNDWQVHGAGADTIATKNDKPAELHKYENQPEVESLRWISTVVRNYLVANKKKPTEVQAAIGDKGHLLVSTNNKDSNKYLVDHLPPPGQKSANGLSPVVSFMHTVLKNAQSAATETRAAVLDRDKRHSENLDKLTQEELTKNTEDAVPVRYQKVLDAINKGVIVATRGDNLHAELRIRLHNGGETPQFLAGTKRPCSDCFSVLYPNTPETRLDEPDAIRPGPYFFPKGLSADLRPEGEPEAKAEELFNRINTNVHRTYRSKARDGSEFYDHGSDSEPD
jgi:hypothetical protein